MVLKKKTCMETCYECEGQLGFEGLHNGDCMNRMCILHFYKQKLNQG